jgi:hypothetical protein
MSEKRGGRRKLNITGCKHVFKGTNSKGEFNIYEVQAASEAGQEIRDKLTSWVELPLGVREYDVAPYEKNGVFQSWTLTVPKDQGGNAAAAREALARRVEFLEQQVEWLNNKVGSLEATQALLSSTQQPQQPATPVGGAPTYQGHDPDDIPF